MINLSELSLDNFNKELLQKVSGEFLFYKCALIRPLTFPALSPADRIRLHELRLSVENVLTGLKYLSVEEVCHRARLQEIRGRMAELGIKKPTSR